MLPEAAAVMTAAGAPRWSLFFLLKLTDGSYVRAWLGVGDYDLPADAVDLTGGTYLGIGLVGDIPALRQLVGGVAERVEFTLNGADDRTLRLADEDKDIVRDAEVYVGILFFDDHWQAVAEPAWLWDGTADVVTVEVDGSGDMLTRAIRLSVGSAFTDRTKVSLGFYTPQDQRRRYPGDSFCDRVPLYGVDSTIIWPAPG